MRNQELAHAQNDAVFRGEMTNRESGRSGQKCIKFDTFLGLVTPFTKVYANSCVSYANPFPNQPPQPRKPSFKTPTPTTNIINLHP